jgi:uncharacterized membrane protein
METKGLEARSFAERFSDAISNVASTPSFAVGHAVFFAAWVLSQSGVVPWFPVFDPFPFTFLTFVVSLEAIFLSIFVLISQGRMTRQADLRSHLDLQVNLLAEQESTSALKILRSIAEHLDVHDLPDEGLSRPQNQCSRSDRRPGQGDGLTIGESDESSGTGLRHAGSRARGMLSSGYESFEA